jgi:Uma2 family endonuclease
MTAILQPPAESTRSSSENRAHRWTYQEYQRLSDMGFFFKRRVELLGGRIIEMSAQKDLHFAAIELARIAVSRSFGDKFWCRTQGPLHLDRWSGPEPDIAVVPGSPRDYIGTGHPQSASLVLEISDTTLRYDRRKKGPRYARAGYQDYWILNLVDRQLEVYRKPIADPSAPLGWRYAEVAVLSTPASIAPLAAPQGSIAVADLLP